MDVSSLDQSVGMDGQIAGTLGFSGMGAGEGWCRVGVGKRWKGMGRDLVPATGADKVLCVMWCQY